MNSSKLCGLSHYSHKSAIKWSVVDHYGMCGQSCPCCRYRAGELFGSCELCRLGNVEIKYAEHYLKMVLNEKIPGLGDMYSAAHPALHIHHK